MKTGLMMVAAAFAALAGRAAEPGQVRLGGALGARFALTLTNNVLRIDHERSFCAPFRVKTSPEGTFVGIGKHVDALVHFARNSDDPAVRRLKDEMVDALVANQLPDGYTGCMKPEARMTACWDMHETGFIIQALLADYACFGNARALAAAGASASSSSRNGRPPSSSRSACRAGAGTRPPRSTARP